MITTRRLSSQEDDETAGNRQTDSLAGLAIVLLLVIVGLQLVHVLRDSAAVQDCLMAGRHDCDALVAPRPIP